MRTGATGTVRADRFFVVLVLVLAALFAGCGATDGADDDSTDDRALVDLPDITGEHQRLKDTERRLARADIPYEVVDVTGLGRAPDPAWIVTAVDPDVSAVEPGTVVVLLALPRWEYAYFYNHDPRIGRVDRGLDPRRVARRWKAPSSLVYYRRRGSERLLPVPPPGWVTTGRTSPRAGEPWTSHSPLVVEVYKAPEVIEPEPDIDTEDGGYADGEDSGDNSLIDGGWTNDALTPGYTGCRQGYPGGLVNGVYWWKPIDC
jgi:hypothetical protein